MSLLLALALTAVLIVACSESFTQTTTNDKDGSIGQDDSNSGSGSDTNNGSPENSNSDENTDAGHIVADGNTSSDGGSSYVQDFRATRELLRDFDK